MIIYNLKRMSFCKDGLFNFLTIKNEDEVYVYENVDEENSVDSVAPIVCEGGCVIKKGLKVGFQENLVPGLIIYDNENFYGFSEKHGLCQLNQIKQSTIRLQLPDTLFADRKKIQSVQSNTQTSMTTNSVDTNSLKRMNIDITVKDISRFYLIIPEQYLSTTFHLHFDIKFMFVENTVYNIFELYIINESNKKLSFDIKNNNVYWRENSNKNIKEREIKEIICKKISNQHYIMNTDTYLS